MRSGPGGANEEKENEYFENLLSKMMQITGIIANIKLRICKGYFVDGRSEMASRWPLFSWQQGITSEDVLLVWEDPCPAIAGS